MPLLCIILLSSSCMTTDSLSSSGQRPIVTNKKAVIGAYCEVAIPPEEVKIVIKTETKGSKTPDSEDGKVYYFFLAHSSSHPAIPFEFKNQDEWYLVISEDPETQEKMKKMTPMETGLMAVAEIPPLTEFYQTIVSQLPESLRSRVQDLNLYKIYRSFGYQILPKAAPRDVAPNYNSSPNSNNAPKKSTPGAR